jgi:hypothetical protein
MAHGFNILVHTPNFGILQESVKRNDKQLLNLLNADNNSASAPISSGGPSFHVVIASGMSPVHGLSLSETYCVENARLFQSTSSSLTPPRVPRYIPTAA